jgi:hypothetical protein
MKIKKCSDNKYSVYIYTNDHGPPHVHIFIGVKKGNKDHSHKGNYSKNENSKELVILIGNELEAPSIKELKDDKIKKKDVKAALEIVAMHQRELLEKWYEIYPSQIGQR